MPGGTTAQSARRPGARRDRSRRGRAARRANLGGVEVARASHGARCSPRRARSRPRASSTLRSSCCPTARPLSQRRARAGPPGHRRVHRRGSSAVGRPRDCCPGPPPRPQLRLESPLAADPRRSLRDPRVLTAATIGGGLILDPHAPRSGIRHGRLRRSIRAPSAARHRSRRSALRRSGRSWKSRGQGFARSDNSRTRAGVPPVQRRRRLAARLVAAAPPVDEVGGHLVRGWVARAPRSSAWSGLSATSISAAPLGGYSARRGPGATLRGSPPSALRACAGGSGERLAGRRSRSPRS